MGLFNLMKGKKENSENNVPPPAPGPNNQNVVSSPETPQPSAGISQAPPQDNMNGQSPQTGNNDNNSNNNSNPFGNIDVPAPPSFSDNESQGDEQNSSFAQPEVPTVPSFDQSNNSLEPGSNVSLPEENKPEEDNVLEPASQEKIEEIPQDKEEKIEEPKAEDFKETSEPEEKIEEQFPLPNIELDQGDENDQAPENNVPEKMPDEFSAERQDYHDNSFYSSIPQRKLKIFRYNEGPIFIEINDYKHLLDNVDEIKNGLKKSGDYIFKLEEYNEQKHYECEQWKASLEDIQRKMVYIQKTLFEGPR